MRPDFRNPEILRREQYRDASNLRARVALHDRFSTNPTPWLEWVRGSVELERGARVLDVGAGPGALWGDGRELVRGLGLLVLGDLSNGMAAEARRQVSAARACVLDAQRIPFADARFDAAVANHMLYHVPDVAAALAELHRVLRPGGRLWASTNGEDHLRELDDLVQAAAPGGSIPQMKSSLRAFSLESGAELIGRVFEEVELRRYEDALRVTEVEPLVAYVRSMGLREADAAALERVRERAARQLEADGVVHITKSVGIFTARRGA